MPTSLQVYSLPYKDVKGDELVAEDSELEAHMHQELQKSEEATWY